MEKETLTQKLTRQRWIVLIISCIIGLCFGSFFTWSVFSGPLCEKLGVSDLSLAFTIANGVGPVTMILGGYVNDRVGPKKILLLGGIMYGVGHVLTGLAGSVAMVIFAYGILVGLSYGLVYGCIIGNTVKLFPDHRGLAGGMTTAAFGLAAVILPLVANALISHLDITMAFCSIGIVFAVIVCIGSFFVTACPQNFCPQGFTPAAGQEDDKSINWPQMLRTPVFYVMVLMLACGGVFGLMIISNASVLAQNIAGLSVSASATVVAAISLFNTGGRVLAGFISDLLGRIWTLRGAMAMAVFGLGLLYLAAGKGNLALFLTGIAFVGLCYGTFMGVYPGFTTDRFGAKYNTINYGFMWIGFSIAGLVGPSILRVVYATSGMYQNAFVLAAVIAIFGLILSVLYVHMNKAKA